MLNISLSLGGGLKRKICRPQVSILSQPPFNSQMIHYFVVNEFFMFYGYVLVDTSSKYKVHKMETQPESSKLFEKLEIIGVAASWTIVCKANLVIFRKGDCKPKLE